MGKGGFERNKAIIDTNLIAALAQCEQLIDQQQDYAGAARQVRALMFIARFADDIERRREQLGQ